MENLNEIIANNLTFLRKHKNLTQGELANQLQYSDKTISKWETGEIVPSVENLIKLCSIYNVTLDQITTPLDKEKFEPKKSKNYEVQNKIIITLLAILAVWITATAMFVYAKIIWDISPWIVFIWAVPASCIVSLVFNSLWGKRVLGFVIISALLWTLITALYLQFLTYNLFAMYFIGIPLQAAVFLWAGLKKSK